METRSFKDIDGAVSLLGFGLMRLPTRSSDKKDIESQRDADGRHGHSRRRELLRHRLGVP